MYCPIDLVLFTSSSMAWMLATSSRFATLEIDGLSALSFFHWLPFLHLHSQSPVEYWDALQGVMLRAGTSAGSWHGQPHIDKWKSDSMGLEVAIWGGRLSGDFWREGGQRKEKNKERNKGTLPFIRVESHSGHLLWLALENACKMKQ